MGYSDATKDSALLVLGKTHKGQPDTDSPEWCHPVIQRYAAQRLRARDLRKGVDCLLSEERRGTYLPMLPRESAKGYRLRVADTPLHNAYKAVVNAATGLVFGNDLSLNAAIVDQRILVWWDDVTGEGTKGTVFFRGVFEQAMDDGWGLVLIDSPDLQPKNRQEESALRLAPYLTHYPADRVRSFRHEKLGGRIRLKQLILSEEVEREDGAFGTTLAEQFRIYQSGVVNPDTGTAAIRVTVWLKQVSPTGKVSYAIESRTFLDPSIRDIPAVEYSTRPSAGAFGAAPPLMDLVDLNLAHLRTSSNLRWALTASCYPMPVRIGYQPPIDDTEAEQTAGPTWIMDLPKEGSFLWVGPPDTGFAPNRTELEDLERRMAVVGMSYIAGESRVQETAAARRISVKAQDATLVIAAKAMEDAVAEVVYHVAAFMAVDYQRESVVMPVNLREPEVDTALLLALWEITKGGGLSPRTFLRSIKTGELPEDFDPEAELAALLGAEPVGLPSGADHTPPSEPVVEEEPTPAPATAG